MGWLPKGDCAICGRHKDVVKDHDHKTKGKRGLLCLACNSGLGQFQDSVAMLQRAIAYLEYWHHHPSKQHYHRVANTKLPFAPSTPFIKIFKQLPPEEQERILKGGH